MSKSVNYILKSSNKLIKQSKDRYNKFLEEFDKLPTSTQNYDDIKYHYHCVCVDVNKFLKELNEYLDKLNESINKNNGIPIGVIKHFHKICILNGNIQSSIDYGSRAIFDILEYIN